MKFVDTARVQLRAGAGGNGCVSFRREKYVPRGGPDGGDGGGGGDILFRGSATRTTLLDFQFRQHFRAKAGQHGRGKNQHGRRGEDLVITVPLGTIVRDGDDGEVLMEVLDETARPCLRGGRGGKGNPRFRTGANKAPDVCEAGEPGEERWVELELKLMADVGLVGFPNAGKSTLISRISRARPRIADYPFTTLVPSLGVVQAGDFESFVVADIPGIIAGAHEGAGLGLRFLKHIERTALLLLLLDCAPPDGAAPLTTYRVLLEELGGFSRPLLEKPRLVALTKADLLADDAALEGLRHSLEASGEQVLPISAVSGRGIDVLVRTLARQVRHRRQEAASGAARYCAPPSPRS